MIIAIEDHLEIWFGWFRKQKRFSHLPWQAVQGWHSLPALSRRHTCELCGSKILTNTPAKTR